MKRKKRKINKSGGSASHRESPRLIFAPSSTKESFTNSTISQFNNCNSAGCIRELIQNSLDAALVASNEEKAMVRFSIKKISMQDIPGIGNYRDAFESAREVWEEKNQAQNVVNEIAECLREKDISVLYVADNGIGFGDKQLDAMLSDGGSHKPERASGSYGNGHLTAFALSRLHYVFYGGVLARGDMLFTGHAILASHIGEKSKASGKDGYFAYKIDDTKLGFDRFSFVQESDIPDVFRLHMETIKDDWGHGALVAIAGFNAFRKDKGIAEIIQEEAALNFFVAISEGRLEVHIDEDGKTTKLSKDDLRALIDSKKGEKKSRRKGLFPSGSRVSSAYQTFIEGNKHIIKTTYGEVCVHLREGGEGRKVALCRNGMWIDDEVPNLRPNNFANKVNFDALILVNSSQEGSEVHDMLRLAEPPLHNQIDLQCISSFDKRRETRKILKEISEKIGELINDRSDETFTVDEILSIQEGSPVTPGTPQPSRPSRGAIIKPVMPGNGSKSKRSVKTKKIRPGRSIGVKISSRQIDNDSKLKAVFSPQEDCADVEMMLSLDEGKDITCAGAEFERSYVTITKISDGSGGFKTINGRSACLGAWTKGENHSLEIHYTLPGSYNPGQQYTLNFHFTQRKVQQIATKSTVEGQ